MVLAVLMLIGNVVTALEPGMLNQSPGTATLIELLCSVQPLLVGQLVGAQWDVRTIFASVGGLVLISALSSAVMALRPPAGVADALPAAAHTSLHA